MNFRRKNPHKTKGGNRRFSRRQMRRKRAFSDAFRDSMNDIRRRWRKGIAK